ncbi:hypothetical protein NDU88_002677 [Pleurodeles waltl]|uniref:Uncharacterized protein n=1 Tax=Pleurodeles waltl TaxID=8319 RepID=A0AAV7RG24_PLEWA|nr:hypothetical protein NDU88_002677 [Pleurodeles waltl]
MATLSPERGRFRGFLPPDPSVAAAEENLPSLGVARCLLGRLESGQFVQRLGVFLLSPLLLELSRLCPQVPPPSLVLRRFLRFLRCSCLSGCSRLSCPRSGYIEKGFTDPDWFLKGLHLGQRSRMQRCEKSKLCEDGALEKKNKSSHLKSSLERLIFYYYYNIGDEVKYAGGTFFSTPFITPSTAERNRACPAPASLTGTATLFCLSRIQRDIGIYFI